MGKEDGQKSLERQRKTDNQPVDPLSLPQDPQEHEAGHQPEHETPHRFQVPTDRRDQVHKHGEPGVGGAHFYYDENHER